jgi:competence protein ComEC
VTLLRSGREWQVLLSRNRQRTEERALAAACERSDIVVADRWLPRSCRPRWLKVDGRMLSETGGLAVVLGRQQVTTVADSQGDHGWWRGTLPL